MAVLATTDDVADLMQDSSLGEGYVNVLLGTVDLILTKVYEYYTGTISDALLAKIKACYVAHIIASTTSRVAMEEQIGDARIKYAGQWGKGFESTPYGQLLLALDPSGLIAKTGLKAASLYAVKSFE
jgi:hypothetical protein